MKKYIYQKFLLMCDYDSIDIDDYEIYHENIALVLPYTMKKCLLDYNTEFVRKINVEDIDNIIKYNLIVGISSVEFVKAIGERFDPIKVFIEIETGMGRTGVKPEDLQDFINIVKSYPNIQVVGCYTHFSVADSDSLEDTEFTNNQINKFDSMAVLLKREFPNINILLCFL